MKSTHIVVLSIRAVPVSYVTARLVFIGRTDFPERKASFPHDDVRPMIAELCEQGIHISQDSSRRDTTGRPFDEHIVLEKRRLRLDHLGRYFHLDDYHTAL